MKNINLHTVKISGPNMNREFKVYEALAVQIYQSLVKIGDDKLIGIDSENETLDILNQKLSPQEYLIQVNAKTNPEKITAFTKYLMETGLQSIETTELRLQFQNAREPVPHNFKRDLDKAVKFGWITSSSEGKYYITSSGEEILKSKFTTKKKVRSRITSKTTKRPGKALFVETPLRKEVDQLNLDPSLDGFKGYHQLTKSADKILWLLVKAKSLGVDKLNQREITYLSEKIGDHIPRKSISSVISPYLGKRLFAPIEGGVRYLKILNEGENYLKINQNSVVG